METRSPNAHTSRSLSSLDSLARKLAPPQLNSPSDFAPADLDSPYSPLGFVFRSHGFSGFSRLKPGFWLALATNDRLRQSTESPEPLRHLEEAARTVRASRFLSWTRCPYRPSSGLVRPNSPPDPNGPIQPSSVRKLNPLALGQLGPVQQPSSPFGPVRPKSSFGPIRPPSSSPTRPAHF
ncbi:hypothetical protein CRG98_043092 [Punica granatum]|uniref:Uncharacterized protein n=1 Tax=Punica granatum TaxID=22663 RepID=A0A2I0HXT6_PUNGR|nr:hypothetical protein CRG98_043092 [Punica granatum]